MIYLLSQIAISLALAAILGGAIGWILHRVRVTKQMHQLHDIIDRQQQQVSEAQTEVSILTADFDDLKQSSETEIRSLKRENTKIPALHQNLEKSQLLVRQLMEKHKTEHDETNEENEKLLVKSRLVDDREKEISRLQAELDIERSKTTQANEAKSKLSSSSTKNMKGESPTAPTTPDPVKLPVSAELPVGAEGVSANSEVDGVRHSLEDIIDSNDDTLPNTAQTKSELTELRDQLAEDVSTTTTDREDNSHFVEVNQSLSAVHKSAETEIDDTHLELMFDTVEQHDDLKQIFGIGPVTEKTLNKLGITAYSQLAELKQHDIEKIANALQIFPGRIERDNWVGGARAQLEEVLEDL